MGTGNSLCYQNASVHSVPPVNRAPLSKAKSTTWKQAISKDDARIKYEEEGTVPIDCSAR